jgi:hypothetical protein
LPKVVSFGAAWKDSLVLASSGADERYRDDRSGPNPRPAKGRGGRGGLSGAVKDRPRGWGERKRKPAPDPGPPPAPVRRFLSLTIAGFSFILGFGLVIGSQATQIGFTVVILGAQVLFVLAWTVASRPPNPWVPGVVGVATAIGSAVAVNWPVQATIRPLGYVIVAGFVA